MKIVTRVVENRLPQLTARMQTMASRAVRKTLFDIEATIKTSMEGPKSGLLYPRPGGTWHQASAPGEAPAIDLGALHNSIQTAMDSPLALSGLGLAVFAAPFKGSPPNASVTVVLRADGSRMKFALAEPAGLEEQPHQRPAHNVVGSGICSSQPRSRFRWCC